MSLERRLAWRNVWRNRRRTGLCVAATVFAVFLVVLSVAMAAGTHEKMIEDGALLHSGHVTISGPGYLDDHTLERFLVPDEALMDAVTRDPDIRGWAPRVASFALLSEETASQGAAVIGIDPVRERTVSSLADRVDQGRFLSEGSRSGAGDAPVVREIVLGRRLAESLGVGLGDEVLLYAVAYSLETAYDLFTVVGTLRLPEPELERNLSLIHLADAQTFYVYDDRLSEIALRLDSADEVGPVVERLSAALPGLEVHPWYDVLPELEQFIILDDLGMYLMLAILVVVVAFGILNTILMAILERTRELGMMMALGLRPGAVFRVVYWESTFTAGVGLVLGLLLALPAVIYLSAHPIPLTGDMGGMTELFGMEPVMTFKLKPLNPLGSALTILVVGAVAALYPAFKASRGRAVDALRTL
jgi:ABC-type lipoprotein release transport system permease subunit